MFPATSSSSSSSSASSLGGEIDPTRARLMGIPGVPMLEGKKTHADYAREFDIPEEKVAQLLNALCGRKRSTEAEMEAFKTIASRYGIKHNPDLNSEVTANMWLRQKLAEAQKEKDPKKREKAMAKWSQYVVDFQDLDNDPITPENLLVLNKTNPKDIYSIDGFKLSNKAPHLVQRGIYDMFPTRAERQKFSELQPEYKRYLRKYLTPEERELHPYTIEEAQRFVHQDSIYQIVNRLVSTRSKE